MRTSSKNDQPTYSPDDGDLDGFTALLKRWVEADKLPIRGRDIERFAAAHTVRHGELRTREQWLKRLAVYIGSQEMPTAEEIHRSAHYSRRNQGPEVG